MQQRDFRQLYRQIHLFFRNRGLPLEESQDLAQETFLEVTRSLGTFRGDAEFSTWVFAIAKNVWCGYCRRRHTLEGTAEMVPIQSAEQGEWRSVQGGSGTAADPLRDSMARQAYDQLWAAIQDLPDDMRRCVVLQVGQGMRYREIAAVLKISLNRVRSLLFQARGHLKRRLGDSWSFET